MTAGLGLDDIQADVLREVGNIGAGHAATALSELLGQEIQLSVTSAKVFPFSSIADVVGGAEIVVAGVFLRISGDITGNIMFLLPITSALALTGQLLGRGDGATDFDELAISALGEVGNILTGSYLAAINALTGLRMQPTVPAVAVDMAGAVLDIGLISIGEVADEAILIDSTIFQGSTHMKAHFFLLPDPVSTHPLLTALGVSNG